MFRHKYELEIMKYDIEKDAEVGNIKLTFDTAEEMNDILMSILSAECSPELILFNRRTFIVKE